MIVAAILFHAALRLFAFARAKPALRAPAAPCSRIEPFLLGLVAAALNPLSVPYFAAFFLSHAGTRMAMVLSCCTVFIIAGTWFASLGVAASKFRGVAWPPLYRSAGSLAAAAILVSLASRSLLLAFLV